MKSSEIMLCALLFSLVASRTLTVLFTDRAYEKMTHDLLKELTRYRGALSTDVTRVYILNDEFAAQNSSWSFEGIRDVQVSHLRNPTTRNYFQRIAPRFKVLSGLLTSLEFNGVLMLDSDVVVFRNIATRLERLGGDIVVQREVPCSKRLCLNAGVMWVRTRAPLVQKMIAKSLEFMDKLRFSDQDALQMVISINADQKIVEEDVNTIFIPDYRRTLWNRPNHHIVRVLYLNPTQYPNGFVHQINQRLSKHRVHLVHVNWANSTAQKQLRLDEIRASRVVSSKQYPFLRTPLQVDVKGIRFILDVLLDSHRTAHNYATKLDILQGHDPEEHLGAPQQPCYLFNRQFYACAADNQRNRTWTPR
jgi:hypothetical protein